MMKMAHFETNPCVKVGQVSIRWIDEQYINTKGVASGVDIVCYAGDSVIYGHTSYVVFVRRFGGGVEAWPLICLPNEDMARIVILDLANRFNQIMGPTCEESITKAMLAACQHFGLHVFEKCYTKAVDDKNMQWYYYWVRTESLRKR